MQYDHPEISVILPFYNAEASLRRTLESIEKQSFTNFECILIDNNSRDGSAEIAKKYCQSDRRFRLVKEQQQGIVFALNTGIANASGRYIARMDADDIMLKERLLLQRNFLLFSPDCDVVAGRAIYFPHVPETKGFMRYVEWSNSLLDEGTIALKQFIESPIIHPTVMWRREISEAYGNYQNGPFPEDYELWLRWLSQGVRIRKIPEFVIEWHDSGNRLTRTDSRYSDEAFFKIKTQYLAQWLRRTNPFYPEVAVWGASKISRKRAGMLGDFGISIQAYIDISTKRTLDKPLIHYTDIPPAGKLFILVYLKEESMRKKTCLYLSEQGYVEGMHYLLVS